MTRWMALVLLMVNLLVSVTVVLAQGEEIPPTGETSAALLTLTTMAGSVAAFIEWLKATFFRPLWTRTGWSDTAYAAVVQSVAILASVVLVAAYPTTNLFAAVGIFPDISPILASLVTALAISFGNMVLHALHDFLMSGASKVSVNAERSTVIAENTKVQT